jgi:preprotein translocase subunit YajC
MTPILLMVLVFYLLILRPQQKRESKRRDLINSMKRGDRILVGGGIIGVLHKVIGEKEISVDLAEGVRIRVLKNSVTDVLEKNSELGNEDKEESPVTPPKAAAKMTAKNSKK